MSHAPLCFVSFPSSSPQLLALSPCRHAGHVTLSMRSPAADAAVGPGTLPLSLSSLNLPHPLSNLAMRILAAPTAWAATIAKWTTWATVWAAAGSTP